jgi:hypothetical protein
MGSEATRGPRVRGGERRRPEWTEWSKEEIEVCAGAKDGGIEIQNEKCCRRASWMQFYSHWRKRRRDISSEGDIRVVTKKAGVVIVCRRFELKFYSIMTVEKS